MGSDAAFAAIGVDPAWRPSRHPSAVAVLRGTSEGAELTYLRTDHRSLEAVRNSIIRHAEPRATVAIDAPLVIANLHGQRPCETQLSRAFGSRHASAHSTSLTRYPEPATVALADSLARCGFQHATPAPTAGDRMMLEVYPHAAMVALFDLPTVLRYKKGKVAQRRAGLATLRDLLAHRLPTAAPALRPSPLLREVLTTDLAHLKGEGLKRYEDGLDALFCAYLALLHRASGGDAFRIFGDLATGYIANPVRSLTEA